MSKDEHFYGIKSDVSLAVPFYANGFAHRPKEIRKDKAYSPLFIGYADSLAMLMMSIGRIRRRSVLEINLTL
jgi:hypothetical protein